MDSQPEALNQRVHECDAEITSGRTGWNRSLREQLRWIRVNQKPYLTQSQLALLARAEPKWRVERLPLGRPLLQWQRKTLWRRRSRAGAVSHFHRARPSRILAFPWQT